MAHAQRQINSTEGLHAYLLELVEVRLRHATGKNEHVKATVAAIARKSGGPPAMAHRPGQWRMGNSEDVGVRVPALERGASMIFTKGNQWCMLCVLGLTFFRVCGQLNDLTNYALMLF